jgi:hypothetical protein
MATFLSKVVTDPQSADEGVDIASLGQELQALVDKYTESFPTRLVLNGSARPLPPRDVYLLTGTTGGLGSNMLGYLLDIEIMWLWAVIDSSFKTSFEFFLEGFVCSGESAGCQGRYGSCIHHPLRRFEILPERFVYVLGSNS